MTITFEEMKDIAKTLPIGYYLGRKVEVTIDPGGGAYADVVKSRIHVGMDILKQAASHIEAAEAAKWDREKLLRCVLYHEVGHILLTSADLTYAASAVERYLTGDAGDWCSVLSLQTRHKIMNVFEDERLECVLASVFMGVDFKAFCNLVNKGAVASKDPVMELLDVVRLRRTTKEVSARIDDIIGRHARLTAKSKYGKEMVEYVKDVFTLAYDVIGKPKEEPKDEPKEELKTEPSPGSTDAESEDAESEDAGNGGNDEDGDRDEEGGGDGESEGESEDADGDGEPQDGKPEPQDGDGESDGEGDEAEAEADETDAEAKSEADEAEADEADAEADADAEPVEGEPTADGKAIVPRTVSLPPDFLEGVADKIFVEPTREVQEKFSQLARRLAKKRGLQAAGRYSALHGKINVKRDAMGKERIFRRAADVGDAMNRGTNITLWVDVSGSFYSSVPVLNRILVAAHRIAKIDQNIRINLVKMSTRAEVAGPDEWEIHAGGGNCIGKSYLAAYKRTRDKTRRNIDVVVFDGDAKSDYLTPAEKVPGVCVEQQIWNHPDCHIVSDTTNRRYFDKLHNAHVTYVNDGYAERLEQEFIKIVDRIM